MLVLTSNVPTCFILLSLWLRGTERVPLEACSQPVETSTNRGKAKQASVNVPLDQVSVIIKLSMFIK